MNAEQKENDKVNEAEYQKTLTVKKDEIEASPASVADVKIEALKSAAKSEAPKEHKEEKVPEKKEVQTVGTLAQLHNAAHDSGTVASEKQIAQVREVEAKALEEGGKKHRLSASKR